MILQALDQYYHRLSSDQGSGIAPYGQEEKEIPFVIVLGSDGQFVQIEDTRSVNGKQKIARTYLVPQGVKRVGQAAANLLWDNTAFALGLDTKGDPERTAKYHGAFLDRVKEATLATEDPAVVAVSRFLDSDRAGLREDPLWPELEASVGNLSFRLSDEFLLACQKPKLTKWAASAANPSDVTGFCLVSGDHGPVARLHPPIKGVRGTQAAGGNIVSFDKPAFRSQGKKQGYNAPISETATFAYTTALNKLLAKDSRQKIQVADATTAFWASAPNDMEVVFPQAVTGPNNPRDADEVKAFYKTVKNGLRPLEADLTRFCVLGLAPNAGRISIRFWHDGTVGQVAKAIIQHYDDLAICHGPLEMEHLPLFRLLVSLATLNKAENIPANLAGEFMRSILAETPYPQTVLATAVRRARAQQNVTYPLAAMIKAVLVRYSRYYNADDKEVDVTLDTTNTNTGYLLGRLFATLERIQETANPGINATIRDRFYASASATPVTAFSHLLKLKNHHLSKIDNRGFVVNLEKLIGGIMAGLDDFPGHMSLHDQGRFAIGYYHQRQDFFTKHEKVETPAEPAESN